MIDELGGGLWRSVLLEVAAGPDTYEGTARHTPGDSFWIIDRPYPDRQINPIFDHISHEVRENEINLQTGMA